MPSNVSSNEQRLLMVTYIDCLYYITGKTKLLQSFLLITYKQENSHKMYNVVILVAYCGPNGQFEF